MDYATPGLHHVTAIAADAQLNLDFYTGLLGLRLVKRTVNFDDPGSYHLYYGDERGTPGTLLTFFIWPGAGRVRQGTRQAYDTMLAVPRGSLPRWTRRLAEAGVQARPAAPRFAEAALQVQDPDGMRLELVETDRGDPRWRAWDAAAPGDLAVLGVYGVALAVEAHTRTAAALERDLGMKPMATEGTRFRFAAGAGGPGGVIDVLCMPDAPRGGVGPGAVHHVALRAPGDADQAGLLARLREGDVNVSPIMDRTYFRSIYFREPGGVLLEVATDAPGFAVDEPPERLGQRLCLPAFAEPSRAEIVRALPPLRLPTQG